MTPRIPVLTALLAALLACGGGGGGQGGPAAAGPTPKPPVQAPPPIPVPEPGGHGREALYRRLTETYNHQLEALKAETWPFGEAFVEVPPDPHAGYAEGFFTLDKVHQPIRFVDGIQRPLIRAAAEPAEPMRARYEALFDPAGQHPFLWDPAAVRRVAGCLFTGSKVDPGQAAKSGGLWCGLFAPDPAAPSRPVLMRLMDQHKDLSLAFNLRHHMHYSDASGFVSLTRSVWVARYFAINVGVVGQPAPAGYVYVVQTGTGLDSGHPGLHAKYPWEQEVAVPGLVPWSRVLAWRRLERQPGASTPPEFTGPIHVRPGFRDHDPAAWARVLADLSRKSLYTKAHEEGQDWRPLLEKADDDDYLREFRKAHPRRGPEDPELWR